MDGERIQRILGAKVRQLRLLHGMTQVELAKQMGFTSTGAISQVESGQRGLTRENILRLSRIFGVHPSVLFTPIAISDEEMRMFVDLMRLVQASRRDRRAAEALSRIRELARRKS